MTVHRLSEIRCNGSGCNSALAWEGNAHRVRQHASRNCGWIVAQSGGVDYCSPRCLNNPQNAEEAP